MADDRTADKGKGALLPEECVSLYTEHVSGKALSEEVNRALSRDTTYRMKELTHVRGIIASCSVGILFCACKDIRYRVVGLHHMKTLCELLTVNMHK